MPKSMPALLLPALMPALMLVGCSQSEPDAPPEANAMTEEPATPVSAPTADALPAPAPAPSVTTNAADALPPGADVDVEDQMMDDATATGMTARVEREPDEQSAPPPANVEAP